MNILAVDDEYYSLELLKSTLNEVACDATVYLCRSASNALSIANTETIDVAFLDIHMPEMNGIQLAHELKRIHPRVNIIFATGFSEYMKEGLDLRMSGYIFKPVTAEAVRAELEVQIPLLSRAEIARASIDQNGKIIVAPTLDCAIDIANEIAPEHLELCVDAPFDYLDKIRHAGSIFMGRYCPEALGDYYAGPNHTLPTSGTARFSSPLSVDDFVKKTQYTYYTRDALSRVANDVAFFAEKEGLTAHAKSAVIRIEEER